MFVLHIVYIFNPGSRRATMFRMAFTSNTSPPLRAKPPLPTMQTTNYKNWRYRLVWERHDRARPIHPPSILFCVPPYPIPGVPDSACRTYNSLTGCHDLLPLFQYISTLVSVVSYFSFSRQGCGHSMLQLVLLLAYESAPHVVRRVPGTHSTSAKPKPCKALL